MSRIYIGEIPVDLLTVQEVLKKIEFLIENSSQPNQIVTLNALMFNLTLNDRDLRTAIQNATIVVPDSVGIVLASKIFSSKKPTQLKRIPGIDLMLKICKLSEEKNYKIFFIGAKPKIIQQAVTNIKKTFTKLNIAGFHHGYFRENNDEKIIEKVQNVNPDIIFVGLNIPKQEKWIYKNLNRVKAKIIMGVGGSFDIISGKLYRAPKFMQEIHLEWLFRFLQEPWRIKRIINLPVFIWHVLQLRMKNSFRRLWRNPTSRMSL